MLKSLSDFQAYILTLLCCFEREEVTLMTVKVLKCLSQPFTNIHSSPNILFQQFSDCVFFHYCLVLYLSMYSLVASLSFIYVGELHRDKMKLVIPQT